MCADPSRAMALHRRLLRAIRRENPFTSMVSQIRCHGRMFFSTSHVGSAASSPADRTDTEEFSGSAESSKVYVSLGRYEPGTNEQKTDGLDNLSAMMRVLMETKKDDITMVILWIYHIDHQSQLSHCGADGKAIRWTFLNNIRTMSLAVWRH